MSKIINTETNEVVYNNEDKNSCGAVLDYLGEKNHCLVISESRSEFIKTMGNFTLTELAEMIEDIMECSEEAEIMYVLSPDNNEQYYVLGEDNEENQELWNKILQEYYPQLKVIG